MFGEYLVVPTQASESGAYGCELWLSTVLPVGHTEHHPIYLSRQSVTILHGSPRVLIVDIQCKAFSVIIIVAHFPHSCTDATKAWYAEHADIIAKHVGGREMIMLCARMRRLAVPTMVCQEVLVLPKIRLPLVSSCPFVSVLV